MFQPRQDPVRPLASIYLRGETWWCKLKNERGQWVAKSTKCKREQEVEAARYAATAQKVLDRKRAALTTEPTGAITVATYAERWVKARDARGIAATADEDRRLRLHVLPAIGAMRLADVRPMHIRDVVRTLRQTDAAPRTVLHVYGAIRGLFADAVGDELIAETPCRLARGELPRKVDADPEWRAQATYTTAEVEQLISDPRIPPERRVQYALKAIAGARHSEGERCRKRSVALTGEPAASQAIAPPKSSVAKDKPARPAAFRPWMWLGHNLATVGALFAAQRIGRREFARDVAAVLDYDCRDLSNVTIHGEAGRRAWKACGNAHVMALRESQPR